MHYSRSAASRKSDLIRFQTLLGAASLISFVWAALQYVPALDKQLMDSPRISGLSLRATPGN